jgi:fatty-acyl-CoA synthase
VWRWAVANWALSAGLKEKDVVALMMDNRPEFIFMWLGMAKIGVLTSLINTNLRGQVRSRPLSS